MRLGARVLAVAILALAGRASADPPVAPAPAPAIAPLPPSLDPATRTVAYSDGFILQNDWGLVRLYPRVSLAVDLRGTVAAGVSQFAGPDGSPELTPRFVLRRGFFELGGGALGFLDLKVAVDIDGRGTWGDALLAGAHDLKVGVPNAWINAEAGPLLNVMVGVQPTPFSLEHRTDPDDLFMLERSVASELAVPFTRALGATVWGTALHKLCGYDVMWITAVGNTMPTSFAERGVAGRIFYRPYAYQSSRWDRLQLGLSGRWTTRDGKSADESRDDVVTGNGYALFRRRYVDSRGRTELILPSGTQRAIAIEAVSPLFEGFNLTGEAYFFADDTREAIASSTTPATERSGSIRGGGWYALVSYVIDPLFKDKRRWSRTHDVHYSLAKSLDAGLYPHPKRRDAVGVQSAIESLTDLQFSLRVGRLLADYRPDDTSGATAVRDPRTPGGPIDVWEIGGTVSVWWTRIFRFTLGWQSYLAPRAGSPENRVLLPGQLAGVPDARWMHELTLRARMSL